MQIAAVGVGGAGGRIVDRLYQDDQRRHVSYLGGACVVDTDTDELQDLEHVPSDNRHAFGQFVTEGTGTDGDRTAGIEAIEDHRLEVRRAIDPLVTSEVDAIVLVAGLAGGTGGTVGYIADSLAEIYERPIFTVTVLPADQDEQAATNTVQALRSLTSTVDGQLLFDTRAWLGSGETVADNAHALNTTLTERLGTLFAAGEVSDSTGVGQRVVDASEIINTLSASGFATLGYGKQEVETPTDDTGETLLDRLQGYFSTDEPADVDVSSAHKAVETTLRRAVRGKLTAECTRSSTDRALAVFAGPPEWLMQEAVDDGRRWLETELQSPEIRSGDVPRQETDAVSVLVLCSGITEVPRLTELEDIAT